ncbi:MAG TPA: hypothetical protein VG602_00185 [Actinomycetota bacterium]|nr:hypothetical protein [Actinomycetota bacterium]
MRKPKPEQVHEPSGFSPEGYRTSRRWLIAVLATAAVLIASVLGLLRLRGVL